jgi:predicted dinucleotide-binding enzyme
MTIAILGAGNMGKGLGKRLAEAGEDVVLIARNEAKTAEVAKSLGKNVRAGSPSEAADADIVILAVPYQNAGDAITEAGGLSGRILIDISNAVGPDMSQAITGESSAAEESRGLRRKPRSSKRSTRSLRACSKACSITTGHKSSWPAMTRPPRRRWQP